MVKGTVSDTVIEVLYKIPESKRKKVKEVTLDLAPTMERSLREVFQKLNWYLIDFISKTS
ncbi:MAG: hypothetical protein IPP05_07070 [Cytophagaceae bacterium]|nr:hypothetical protein [Cytophagaceae bacterium]